MRRETVFHEFGTEAHGRTPAELWEAVGWTIGGEWRRFAKVPAQLPGMKPGTTDPIPETWGVRDQFGLTLPGAVGADFTPYQLETMVSFTETCREVGGLQPVVAGWADRKRLAWVLCKAPGEFQVRLPGGVVDVTHPYHLLKQGLVGTSSFVDAFVASRASCSNAISMLLSDTQCEFRLRHTSGIHWRAAEAQRCLALAAKHLSAVEAEAQRLAELPMELRSFKEFACAWMTGQETAEAGVKAVSEAEGRKLAEVEKVGEALTHLFQHGAGNRGRNRWDAYNAVTEFLDHQRGRIRKWRSLDARFGSLSGGDAEKKKRRAHRLLARW